MGRANYELIQQFLVEYFFGLRAYSVEILGLCSASATHRTVLESIKDSGDLVSVADLTVINNQNRETLQLIVDYKLKALASESCKGLRCALRSTACPEAVCAHLGEM